jgi:hypothetical protein
VVHLHKLVEGDAKAGGELIDFKIIKEEEMYDYIR